MAVFLFVLFFFFSSRRRHTRSTRDWSSDVCSSDLVDQVIVRALAEHQGVAGAVEDVGERDGAVDRSEERRVGKECRSRWARSHKKKKTRRSLTNVEAAMSS